MIIKAESLQAGDLLLVNEYGMDKLWLLTEDVKQSSATPNRIYVKIQEVENTGKTFGNPRAMSYMRDSPVEVYSRVDVGWGDIDYARLQLSHA